MTRPATLPSYPSEHTSACLSSGELNEGARATLSRSSTTPFTSREAPPAKTPSLPDFCDGLRSSSDGLLFGTSTGLRLFISLASSAILNATWLHAPDVRTPPLSVNTFLFLDDSGNGTLERNEVLQSLDESRGQGKGQAGNAAIMKKRFEEMDWDKNGNISYLEFLFALESWVGIEDQEEEDY